LAPEIIEETPAAAAVTAQRRATHALSAGPPSDEVTEELSDDDVSPDSSERRPNPTPDESAPDEFAPNEPAPNEPAPDPEELGRDDAISVPPEELAAFQEAQRAKADAKPPPPPKRAVSLASIPSLLPAEPAALSATSAASPSGPSSTPPTPDPAAAKAAQRAKTRQPWWEDLFNEDFMRASAKVNDEQVRREVTFIEDSLGVAAGGVVLDLGCGAGHHAVELASRGYGVVGYDLSLYQLALAADVAQERGQKINFLQGDMREMAFEEMFDGVFCWNTTFGYFEEDKNLAVAQRVFKALRPGGMFLIDVLNRDFAAASAPQQVWYEGDSCVCMDDMSVDYISSRLRVKRSIILDDGRTKESLFSLRLYSLHELGKLLHEVGFRVTEASGHPATPGVFFGPNSPRIIMLAQRP
jgi:SAM-dependent methyltransferase